VSSNEMFVTAKADSSGTYLYQLDTTPLELGQHYTKSKAARDGQISAFGSAVAFAVGTENVDQPVATTNVSGDVNHDRRVNLIDFSILAYWYKRAAPPSTVDLNGDGKVDLVDFSIMAFHWTG